MQITLTGPFPLPYYSGLPFFDYATDGDLIPISQSPTALVFQSSTTGARSTVTGTGLSVNTTTGAATGTITGWTTHDPSGAEVARVTGVSWGLAEFIVANDALDDDNEGPMVALLSRSPITVDASGATGPMIGILPGGITAPVRFIGSDFRDDFRGSNGNDTIDAGSAPAGYGDVVIASAGSDRIVYSSFQNENSSNWADLVYHIRSASASATVTIDGAANTGSVVKADHLGPVGTDTLVDLRKILDPGNGLGLFGTDGKDSFDIRLTDSQWMIVHGGAGADSYAFTLGGSSGLRLDFRGNWYEWNNAPQGLRMNLAKNRIANDGYGNAEKITVTGTGQLEIMGTRNADQITGSGRKESFITGGGDDTINGGGGVDRIRFDRDQMTSGVEVDLAKGTAKGSWHGSDFTVQLKGIEDVRGTRGFNDTLMGDDKANTLEGRFGANLMDGRNGNDTLYGASGNDTLIGGNGRDILAGYDGNDRLSGGKGNDLLQGGGGNDRLDGGAGNDTLQGDGGNDTLSGGGGKDLLQGGAGGDRLDGGGGNDTLDGGAGNDVLTGGKGADAFVFAKGHGTDRITDFSAPQNDRLLLSADLWTGTLDAAGVIDQFATTHKGKAALKFSAKDIVVFDGLDDLSVLGGQIDIF
jgi:Ca2+-binding RTX toxin-like protein